MTQKTIFPGGEATVTVNASESIIISNYGGGIAQIYYWNTFSNHPPAYRLQQTLNNSSVTLGPFSSEQTIKIDANNSTVNYNTGSIPVIVTDSTINQASGSFDATTGAIVLSDSYNANITYIGVGIYDVAFDNDMANTDYTVVITPYAANRQVYISTKTTGGFRIGHTSLTNVATDSSAILTFNVLSATIS